MKSKCFSIFNVILVSLAIISCSSGVNDSSDDAVSPVASEPSISIKMNSTGRTGRSASFSARAARSAIGSDDMYLVSVTLKGTNYEETNSIALPPESTSASISFMDVPVGEVTAVAIVHNRYHKKWTGTESTTLSTEEGSMEIPLTEGDYDLSGMKTGDIVLSTGGYITRSDYNKDLDQTMGIRYAALKVGSQLYAIQQGKNQSNSATWDACKASADSATGIAWASETNFRLPTKDELQAIYDQKDSWLGIYSSDGAAFGLATTFSYWSSTSSGTSSYYYVLDWYNGTWDDKFKDNSTGSAIGDEYICKLN